MTPEEFTARWQEIADEVLNAPFRVVEAAQIATLQISELDKQWLSQCGLPSETCSFRLDLFPPLQRVYEHFAPGDWTEQQKQTVSDCWALGEDGGGNEVCVTEPDGEVWLLDHEVLFQSREFVNSNTRAFARFLLLDLEGFMGMLTYRECFKQMKQLDPAATQPWTSHGAKTYWCQTMLEQIEDEEH